MQSVSFKQMIKDGSIKRADAMKVQLDDIHEEPGFNERTPGPDLDAYIEAMAQFIMDGGTLPALEVRPRNEGGVWAVDGHCRRKAYRLARDRGAAIEWIEVRGFAGNDADRVARIVSSNNSRPLTPLETSRVYKRLRAFGKSPEEIAKLVGRTRTHVDQMLLLADANSDVHRMVEAGEVSASVAVDVVRQHGEGAGNFLAGKKAATGKKVTAAAIREPLPPRKVVDGFMETVDKLHESITADTHAALKTLNLNQRLMVEVDAVALAGFLEGLRDWDDAVQRRKAKQRENEAKAAQTELPA